MPVPSQTELERFFDDQAPDIQFVETVGSWPSLRVIDYLYRNEPTSTGDIARGLNMDMRDVKDRLDVLADQGIVKESSEGWSTTTDQITISIARTEGIDISYSTANDGQSIDDSVDTDHTAESEEVVGSGDSSRDSDRATEEETSSGSLIARFRRAVESLFG